MSASKTSVIKYRNPEDPSKFNLYIGPQVREDTATTFMQRSCNFDRPFYPDDRTLCILASMALEKFEDWILWKAALNTNDRYFGAAFWHEENQQLVICHRGTKMLSIKKVIRAKDKFEALKEEWNNCIGTLGTDNEGVINYEYTGQVHSACSFAYWVVNTFPRKNFSLTITGHSLGAWEASITTFSLKYLTVNEDHFRYLNEDERKNHKYHPHTVIFDSPGCYEMLCKMSKDFFHIYKDRPHVLISALDITTYFIAPNVINSKNEHEGRLIRLEFELPAEKSAGFFSNILQKSFPHNINYHYLEHFVEAFNQDPDEVPRYEIFNYPVFGIKDTIMEKLKKIFWSSSNRIPYETVLDTNKNNLDDLNKDSILVPYATSKLDETFILMNIFKEDEKHFLESWVELKKHKPNPEFFNEFFANKNYKIMEENISLDNFLPNFEILNDKLKLRPEATNRVGELKDIVNRTKWLLLLSPDVKEIMKKELYSMFEAMYKTRMDCYIDSLPKYEVSFWDRRELGKRIDRDFQILHLKTKNTEDETLVVYNILKKIKKSGEFCIFGINDIYYLSKFVDIIGIFGSTSSIDKVLVINFDDSEDFTIINQFYGKILKGIDKKVICIAEKTPKKSEASVSTKDLDELGLGDITPASLEKLLNRDISINGCPFKLTEFLGTKETAPSQSLPFSTFKEYLTNFKTIHFNFENDIFNKIFFNLTTAKVVKEIKIESVKKIVENYESDGWENIIGKPIENVKFLITGCEDILLLRGLDPIVLHPSTDQEEGLENFHDYCRKHPEKTIFRLHKTNEGTDDLKWLDVFDADLYIKRKFTIDSSEVDEAELLKRDDKVFLVSNTPGMGKSTTLFNLFKHVTNSWTFWVNLIDAHKYIDKSTIDIDSVVRFLLRTCSNSSKLAESLLKIALTNGNSVPVYLFFDAFDEIQDSEKKRKDDIRKQILNIFKYLKEKTTAKIFISTRTHDCELLEKALEVKKAIKLKELTEKEQIEFCTKFWKSKMSLVQFTICRNSNSLNSCAKKLLQCITRSVDRNTLSFLGIPLQLRMIVEVFQPDKNEKIPQMDFGFNLYDLYSQFIERKYEIFFEEKTCFTPDFYKELLKPQFQENHKILGMAHLFPDLSPKIDYKNLNCFNRIGLAQVGNGTISFIHQTFAEYFASELFVYWMENNPEENVKKMLVENVLRKREYAVIQHFISDILASKKKSSKILKFYPDTWAAVNSNSMIDDHWEDKFRFLINNGCAKLMELILENFKYFPGVKSDLMNVSDYRPKSTMLHTAIDSDRLGIALTLLEYGLNLNHQADDRHQNLNYLQLSFQKKKFNSFSLKFLKKVANKEIKEGKKIYYEERQFRHKHPFADRDPWDCITCRDNSDLFFDALELYSNNKTFMEEKAVEIFSSAIRENRTDVAKKLVVNKWLDLENSRLDDLYECDRWGLTAKLVEMRKANHPKKSKKELFQELLELTQDIWCYVLQNCDVNFQKADEPTFLHFAIAQKEINVAKKLTEKGANLNAAFHCYNKTPAYLAIENNCSDFIFDYFDEIDFSIPMGRFKMNLLHLACKKNNIRVALKIINEKKVDLNQEDKINRTPLTIAAEEEHWELALAILKQNVQTVDVDKYGNIALHYACKYNNKDVALKLLQKGANINSIDDYKNTLLLAAKRGHWNLIIKLIEKVTSDKINVSNADDETLLHFACRDNEADLALKLIKEIKADVNSKDKKGFTPVLVAAYNKHWDLVKQMVLLNTVDIALPNSDKKTLLHFACEWNEKEIVELLLKKKADIITADKSGSNPLLLAAKNGHWNLVADLIEKSSKKNISITCIDRLLCLACKDNNLDSAKILIKIGANINCLDNGDNPVLLAAENNNWDLVTELIKSECFDLQLSNGKGRTLIYYACESNKDNLVFTLYNHNKPSLYAFDTFLWSPVSAAADNGHWGLVAKIMKLDDFYSYLSERLQELLFYAERQQNKADVALELIKKGNSDIWKGDKYTSESLYLADICNNWKLVAELLNKDMFNVSLKIYHSQTALHLACRDNQIDLALKLIEKGVDKNAYDSDGSTALLRAAKNGHFNLVKKLLEIDGFAFDIPNKYSKTLLHFACQRNQIDLALSLIEKQVDINYADIAGNNAILLAAGNGHWDLVSKLIEHKASVNSTNRFKENILHLACLDGQNQISLELIKDKEKYDYKFDINCLNSYGRSPVFFAAENGHWDLVSELIELGANPNIPDKDNTTVLHFACRDNQTEIAITLIEKKGCDPNGKDIFGISPLSLAKNNGYDDLVTQISNLLYSIF